MLGPVRFPVAIVGPDVMLTPGVLHVGYFVDGHHLSLGEARRAHERGARLRTVHIPRLAIAPYAPPTN